MVLNVRFTVRILAGGSERARQAKNSFFNLRGIIRVQGNAIWVV